MQIYCNLCHHTLKDGEEIDFTARAKFRLLGSQVAFSVTKPHWADKHSFRHVDCETYYGKEGQP